MKTIYFALVLLPLAQPCFAKDNISKNERKHTVSFNVGAGSIYASELSETDGVLSAGGLFYNYQYDDNWAISTGKMLGFGNCLLFCADDSNFGTISHDNYVLHIKGLLPINNDWSIFGRLGINYYDFEFANDNNVSLSDSGVGAVLAAGVDFRVYKGFGLGFEATWLDMDTVEATVFTLNFSYSF